MQCQRQAGELGDVPAQAHQAEAEAKQRMDKHAETAAAAPKAEAMAAMAEAMAAAEAAAKNACTEYEPSLPQVCSSHLRREMRQLQCFGLQSSALQLSQLVIPHSASVLCTCALL